MNQPEPKPLNSLEVWVADHATPIFLTLAVVILVAAGGIFWTYQKTGNAEDKINVLSPKIAHIVKCNQSSLVDDKRAAECANRIRIGLINCRRSIPCREALLAAIASPAVPETTATSPSPSSSTTTVGATKGGATQNPSTAGQQPGPGQPGHHGGDGDQGGAQEGEEAPAPVAAAPSPSPAPQPAPAPAPSPEPTTGDSGPQTGQETAASGVGVELCVLERTCVGLEVGVPHPKGSP